MKIHTCLSFGVNCGVPTFVCSIRYRAHSKYRSKSVVAILFKSQHDVDDPTFFWRGRNHGREVWVWKLAESRIQAIISNIVDGIRPHVCHIKCVFRMVDIPTWSKLKESVFTQEPTTIEVCFETALSSDYSYQDRLQRVRRGVITLKTSTWQSVIFWYGLRLQTRTWGLRTSTTQSFCRSSSVAWSTYIRWAISLWLGSVYESGHVWFSAVSVEERIWTWT